MSKNHFVSHFLPSQINTTIFIFVIFLQNGCRRPFWISENHFRRISGHFRSIQNFFYFFLQNGRQRPFWMSEIQFRSHFWPFQIDTQLNFFWNFWQNGCRRPFGMSEIHLRSQFWPFQIDTDCFLFSAAILDDCPKITLDRISGHFRSIGHFGCPKFTFDGISGHFRSVRNLNLFLNFHKMTVSRIAARFLNMSKNCQY